MKDVTLSPTMGEYLDMRNNDKADPTRDTRANENYARELMQLFTIGLSQLNLDGTSSWTRAAIRFRPTIRPRSRISRKSTRDGRIPPSRRRSAEA